MNVWSHSQIIYILSLRVGSGISSFINFGETKERIEKGNGHEIYYQVACSGGRFRFDEFTVFKVWVLNFLTLPPASYWRVDK